MPKNLWEILDYEKYEVKVIHFINDILKFIIK
jgi:hypothetical protein